MKMLQEKANAATKAGRMRRVWFSNSFFFTRLIETDREYRYQNVRRWIRREVGGLNHDGVKYLFNEDPTVALERIFFPVNIGNIHWALLVINLFVQEVCMRVFLTRFRSGGGGSQSHHGTWLDPRASNTMTQSFSHTTTTYTHNYHYRHRLSFSFFLSVSFRAHILIRSSGMTL